MGDLILVRGLPGSGKTTLAHLISETVFSADDYFYNELGEYFFDATKITEAHEICIFNTSQAMVRNSPKIIVANTFTTEEEIIPYFELANQYQYRIHTVITENRHGSESVHGVPELVYLKMEDRFSIQLSKK